MMIQHIQRLVGFVIGEIQRNLVMENWTHTYPPGQKIHWPHAFQNLVISAKRWAVNTLFVVAFQTDDCGSIKIISSRGIRGTSKGEVAAGLRRGILERH